MTDAAHRLTAALADRYTVGGAPSAAVPGLKPGLGAARRVPRDAAPASFTTRRRAAPPSRRFSGGITAWEPTADD